MKAKKTKSKSVDPKKHIRDLILVHPETGESEDVNSIENAEGIIADWLGENPNLDIASVAIYERINDVNITDRTQPEVKIHIGSSVADD